MRSHDLQQLVNFESVTSCQFLLQVDCQNLLSTGLLQVVSTKSSKYANGLQPAGKIDNLQVQICGVFGCVKRLVK